MQCVTRHTAIADARQIDARCILCCCCSVATCHLTQCDLVTFSMSFFSLVVAMSHAIWLLPAAEYHKTRHPCMLAQHLYLCVQLQLTNPTFHSVWPRYMLSSYVSQRIDNTKDAVLSTMSDPLTTEHTASINKASTKELHCKPLTVQLRVLSCDLHWHKHCSSSCKQGNHPLQPHTTTADTHDRHGNSGLLSGWQDRCESSFGQKHDWSLLPATVRAH